MLSKTIAGQGVFALAWPGRDDLSEMSDIQECATSLLEETVLVDCDTCQAEMPLAGLKVEPRGHGR